MVADRDDASDPSAPALASASALEVALYIKDLQRQLAAIADGADLPALAALCRAAVIEAARMERRQSEPRGEDAA